MVADYKGSTTKKVFHKGKPYRFFLILALVVLVGGLLSARWLEKKKAAQQEAAHEALWQATYYQEKGDYQRALEGDGISPGFLEVIEKYSNTPAANLARFYVGLIYYDQKKYEEGMQMLKLVKFKSPLLTPRLLAVMGDFYYAQQNFAAALTYYQRAADTYPNKFFSPLYLTKQAQLHEKEYKNYKAALDCYRRIIQLYPDMDGIEEIEKNIGRLEALEAQVKKEGEL